MKSRRLDAWFNTLAILAGISRSELMELPVAEIIARLRRLPEVH